MEMFDKLKLKYHTYKFNKALEKIRKDEQITRAAALDYLLEKIDERLERSNNLISLFRKNKWWEE